MSTESEACKAHRFYMQPKLTVLAEDYLELEIGNLRRLVEQVAHSTLCASNTSEFMRCVQQINKIHERLKRTLEPETLNCEGDEERDRVEACLDKLHALFREVKLDADFSRAVRPPIYRPSAVRMPGSGAKTKTENK